MYTISILVVLSLNIATALLYIIYSTGVIEYCHSFVQWWRVSPSPVNHSPTWRPSMSWYLAKRTLSSSRRTSVGPLPCTRQLTYSSWRVSPCHFLIPCTVRVYRQEPLSLNYLACTIVYKLSLLCRGSHNSLLKAWGKQSC